MRWLLLVAALAAPLLACEAKPADLSPIKPLPPTTPATPPWEKAPAPAAAPSPPPPAPVLERSMTPEEIASYQELLQEKLGGHLSQLSIDKRAETLTRVEVAIELTPGRGVTSATPKVEASYAPFAVAAREAIMAAKIVAPEDAIVRGTVVLVPTFAGNFRHAPPLRYHTIQIIRGTESTPDASAPKK
jgi:hypothetical protein